MFKEHEGSFLVGALAAMKSQTGKVGFVGGMDITLIRRFACGYVQGVKHINTGATVYQKMTGTTPAAWNDPARGGEEQSRGRRLVRGECGVAGGGRSTAAF